MYKPILFNTEMVRAILDNRKTVTRRVIKYENNFDPNYTIDKFLSDGDPQSLVSCSVYQVGDILYVRETWQEKPIEIGGGYIYKADTKCSDVYSWSPSIHMPKVAARIFLKVTGVKVERLLDITAEECIAEGIQECVLTESAYKLNGGKRLYNFADGSGTTYSPIIVYSQLWDTTVKKSDLDRYGWNANPWVWVIEFERCEKPLDFVGGLNNE